MSYLQLAYMHLGTVVPAFILGIVIFSQRKGTAVHKFLGKIYMLLMLTTAIIVLFMPAHIGPTIFGHFGVIHCFSLVVLWYVPLAYFAIRKGQISRHRRAMIGVYAGGVLLAGGFALLPGRLLHQWLLG